MNNNDSSDSLISDVFSIFGHLSRKSEDVTNTVIKILKGNNGNFEIIIKCLNGNQLVKSRCCNMLGNLMKHNDCFYDCLKKNKIIFENLVRCCQTDELNARKSAIFAIGNSIYHNDSLYSYIEEILTIILNLLNDSLAKTRIHSTGMNKNFILILNKYISKTNFIFVQIAAIGNLVNHKFSDKMTNYYFIYIN